MDVVSVTVGLPVCNLLEAVEWYRDALQLPDPDLEPVEGVVEFKVGSIWLQLSEGSATRSTAEVVVRFGIDDTSKQRERLQSAGIAVGPMEHVPGVIEYFDFTDPDGNKLSFYRELN